MFQERPLGEGKEDVQSAGNGTWQHPLREGTPEVANGGSRAEVSEKRERENVKVQGDQPDGDPLAGNLILAQHLIHERRRAFGRSDLRKKEVVDQRVPSRARWGDASSECWEGWKKKKITLTVWDDADWSAPESFGDGRSRGGKETVPGPCRSGKMSASSTKRIC